MYLVVGRKSCGWVLLTYSGELLGGWAVWRSVIAGLTARAQGAQGIFLCLRELFFTGDLFKQLRREGKMCDHRIQIQDHAIPASSPIYRTLHKQTR